MEKKNKPTFNYCEARKRARKVYKTEEELNSRLEKEDPNALYPLKGFFCPSCEGWHVTRHPVVNGKETIDENVSAWKQEMDKARDLSVSISYLIKNVSENLKWGQFSEARQLISIARSKIRQLRLIKNEGAVDELEKKIDSEEKTLISSLRNGKDDSYSQAQQFEEQKVSTDRKADELSPKTIQKIDNKIEEAECLTEDSSSQSYKLIRECQSLIGRMKYGENLTELKRQWNERLEKIKAELKKQKK